MYKRVFIVVLIMMLMITFVYGSDKLDLWYKAQSIAQQNWNWVPGLTVQNSQTIDVKSKEVVDVSELWLSHQPYEDNLILTELVKATSGDKELSKKEARKTWDELMKRDMTPTKDGFFFADEKDLTIIPLDEEEILGDFACSIYQFEYKTSKKGKEDISGKIWLEKETGAPIKREFSMAKNPRFVTGMLVEEYFHYDKNNNQWYREKVETTVNVSVLGKKIDNLTSIDYHDHWLYPN